MDPYLGCCAMIVIFFLSLGAILLYTRKPHRSGSDKEEMSSEKDKISNQKTPEKKESKKIEPEKFEEHKEDRSYSTSSKNKSKRGFSLKSLFGKKKTCEECGTELVYKEDFESYYCPNCHSYK